MSDDHDHFALIAERKGISVPELYESFGDRVYPRPTFKYYDLFKVWNLLDRFRPSGGFGVSALPLSDVITYLNLINVPVIYQHIFIRRLSIIDLEYRKYISSKSDKKTTNGHNK